MATTRVISLTNLVTVPAPPEFFLPSVAGVAVPPGVKSWTLTWDQVNVLTAWSLRVEYHYLGGWQLDVGAAAASGGSFIGDDGLPTTLNFMSSSIGSLGTPIVPDAVRLHVVQWPGVVIPSLTLDLST